MRMDEPDLETDVDALRLRPVEEEPVDFTGFECALCAMVLLCWRLWIYSRAGCR